MLPPLPTIDFDAATPYPEVGLLRSALARGDWPAVRALWAAADLGTRSQLVTSVDHLALGNTGVIRTRLAEDPTDSIAAVLAARHLIADAYILRESAAGRSLTEAQLITRDQTLIRAEEILSEATARRPGDVLAWVERITTAVELQLGPDECRRRYDRSARIVPHHLPGELAFQQALVQRGNGDWAAVHAFSRERMTAAPAGALNGVLVATGHLEHFLRRPDWDLHPLRDAREQLYEAAHRSVWHPEFRRSTGWAYAVNVFACVFALISDRAAADGLFRTLGPIATRQPWARFATHPTETFQHFRAGVTQW